MEEIKASKYALEVWAQRLGSAVVKQLEHRDWSAPYEVDEAHLFELANGKCAVVTESGCSCYDYDDADVTVYDTLEEAKASFPYGR